MLVVKGKIRTPRNWDDEVMVLLDATNNEVPLNIKSIGGKTIANGEKVTGVVINNQFNLCKEYHSSKPKKTKCFGYISDDEITHDYVRITLADELRDGETIWLERNRITNYTSRKKSVR